MAAIVNVASAITPRNTSAQKLTRCPYSVLSVVYPSPLTPQPHLEDAHSDVQVLLRVFPDVREQLLHLRHRPVHVVVELRIRSSASPPSPDPDSALPSAARGSSSRRRVACTARRCSSAAPSCLRPCSACADKLSKFAVTAVRFFASAGSFISWPMLPCPGVDLVRDGRQVFQRRLELSRALGVVQQLAERALCPAPARRSPRGPTR